MHPYRFLALAILFLVAPVFPVWADVVLPPPVPVEVRAVPTAHRGPGAPSRAVFELRNRSYYTFRLQLSSVVCLLDQVRLPLRVLSARANGRNVGETIELRAMERVRLEVSLAGFSEPAAYLEHWVIELEVQVEEPPFYEAVRGRTEVRRAPPRT